MGDGSKKNPYTRKDVDRLIEKHGGKAEGLDLSGKYFEMSIDLKGFDLQGIILNKAVLVDAHLERVNLRRSHLEGADLMEAHLERADLVRAHLEGAGLRCAYLDSADLRFAYLDRADLGGVELEDTRLEKARFTHDTQLEDVIWHKYYIEEEKIGDFEWEEDTRWEYFDPAEDTYRRLKIWYTEHGLYNIAGKFFYREMEVRRKVQSWKKEPLKKLWSWILRILCGYGEKPERVVISAAAIVFGLALAYFLWGSFSSSSFADTLYYSVASFTALGYGQWAPQPTGWAKGFGAAEAVLGVSMMALFLVTFTRKMIR